MVQYFPVITGSLTVNGNLSVSGNVAVTGSMSGTSSLAANAELLSGTGSVGFTTTGSFTVASSSLSSRTTQIESVYATTGSNSFRATQSITGSLTVTGQIVAQTLNVQQVTSSIVYSSGSNVFGCDINSRQTFTGSFYQTGSVAIFNSNVGIGTNSPCHLLHVNSSSPSILLQSTSSTGPAYLRFNNTTRSNTNYIALGGTSNDLFFNVNGADRFFISGSGNVGIGTQTPNRLLSIQGPAESWIESITTQPTTQCWIFGQDGARKGFEVYDLNQTATRLFVAPTTGNVGISNVCPRSPLSFSNGTGDKIDFYNDNVARYSVQVNSGELRFFTCGTDRISLYAGNTVGLVNRSGKIAIAATSTDALFSVGDWCNRGGRLLTSNGSGWAADGVTPCVVITSNTTSTNKAAVIGIALHNDTQTCGAYSPAIVFSRRSYSGIYNSSMAAILAQASTCGNDSNWVAGDLIFATNPIGTYMTENMRIFANGDITFGSCSSTSTNSIYWSRGGNELQLNGSVGSNSPGGAGASFRIGDNNSGARRLWMMQLDGSNYFGTFYYNESIGWTKVGYQTTGGTWTNSDERRKENIVDFNYGLKEVLELKPKMFNYKNDERKVKNLGFIAQQVLPSIPEAVQSDEDDGKQYYAMNYSNLTTVLVKAIQEQQCTICAQASMINTLKTCIGIA